MTAIDLSTDKQPQSVEKQRRPLTIQEWLITGIVWAVAALFLIPVVWMVLSSLKPDYQIFAMPPIIFPQPPRWANYREALTYVPFGRYTVNTAIISLFIIIGHIVSCTVVAYGFARLRAPGRDTLFVVVLATMMLPYPVTMVPLYVLFNEIGWVNTFLPLVVPAFFGNAFYIFLLRQFFLNIPRNIEDAARIDGASVVEIIRYIIFPLSLPAMATVGILTFQFAWNDFLAPLIYLHDQQLYTVSLGLSFFRSSFQVSWAYLMAASLVTMLPVLIVFFVAQNYFIEGISLSRVQ